MPNTVMFLGLNPAERWSMSFPELLLNDTRLLVKLQSLSAVNYIDFRRPNGCHRMIR